VLCFIALVVSLHIILPIIRSRALFHSFLAAHSSRRLFCFTKTPHPSRVARFPQIEKLVLSAIRVLVNLASAPPAATTLARDVCPVLMAALGASDESGGVAASAASAAFQRSVPLLQLVTAFVANLAHHRRCIPELLKHRVC
jgi:hypothetical protein